MIKVNINDRGETMEEKKRILVNKIPREKYVSARMKIVLKNKGTIGMLYMLMIFIISWSISSEVRAFLKNIWGIGVVLLIISFEMVKTTIKEYKKANEYYNLRMGTQGQEIFILLPEGLKHQEDEQLMSWLSMSRAKKRDGIISFKTTEGELILWDEASISIENKQYLETKLIGMKEHKGKTDHK